MADDRHTGAFFVHWYYYLAIAYRARRATASAVEADPNALPPDAHVAIVFSALAVEAFINELAEMAYRDTNTPVTGHAIDSLR